MPVWSKTLTREIKASLAAGLWLAVLACPLLVFRINSMSGNIEYLWDRLPKLFLIAFLASYFWRYFLRQRRQTGAQNVSDPKITASGGPLTRLLQSRPKLKICLKLSVAVLLILPFFSSPYMVKIMTTALIYITLGLGLNIIVGVSGLLHLGYAAFFAVGAYTYAMLNHYFGLGFWICLPLGALSATIVGLLLGLPIIRLSGDYLAIVTLGFGEIVRLILNNLEVTMGPRGFGNIDPPGFFGLDLNARFKPWLMEHLALNEAMDLNKIWIYLIILAIVFLTVLALFRLENSRLGRACLAMREDEIACQAMGISLTKTKLMVFAFGSTWAGLAGVVLAAQITFINPASFSFMESIYILTIVVLGGMSSIPGVIIGAVVISCLPEFLRGTENFRFLIFGGLMVLMMVFRPQGLIQSVRNVYIHPGEDSSPSPGRGNNP
jgi:branched-chain amino acid transport system permease protein